MAKTVTLSSTEYDEYQRYLNAVEWSDGFNTMSGAVNTEPNTLTQMEINGKNIWVMVDTGAAVNVVDEFAYNLLGTKPALVQTKPYYGFGNPERPLDTLGQCTMAVKWRGETLKTNFVVMKGRHQNLVGRSTAVALGMVKLNLGPKPNQEQGTNSVGERPQTHLSKVELEAMFPKLFSGKLGCLNDMEVKLEIDESIKPVKQPLRQIVFHYREPLERELDKQVAEGILEKVDPRTSPIMWISNLVVVHKDEDPRGKITGPKWSELNKAEMEVRLTCNARPVNEALKRTRFPMRTIDDLVVAVNGATIFSKLDTIKAFHQFPLAEESRSLTTITTHKGLIDISGCIWGLQVHPRSLQKRSEICFRTYQARSTCQMTFWCLARQLRSIMQA